MGSSWRPTHPDPTTTAAPTTSVGGYRRLETLAVGRMDVQRRPGEAPHSWPGGRRLLQLQHVAVRRQVRKAWPSPMRAPAAMYHAVLSLAFHTNANATTAMASVRRSTMAERASW